MPVSKYTIRNDFKRCGHSSVIRAVSDFGTINGKLRSYCNNCRVEELANRLLNLIVEKGATKFYKDEYEKQWNSTLRRRFGITADEYEIKFNEQNGQCAICRNPETEVIKGVLPRLVVDHNHSTGKIRGLLCKKCNRGLGHFKDSIEVIQQAVVYLEHYEEQ